MNEFEEAAAKGDTGRMVELIDWAVNLNNEAVSDLYNYDLTDASDKLNEIIGKGMYSVPIYHNFATLRYLQEDYEDSRSWLEKALVLNPLQGEVIRTLGEVCFRLGDMYSAKKHIERSMQLGQVDTGGVEKLVQIYEGEHDYQKSQGYRDILLELELTGK